ncbi:MAG: hydantoinase/oxoprolinase N-terminal domain-containing protein, partial [Gemmatimonadales bacterium]
MTWSLGIDVGGTYTDLAAVGSDGLIETRKVLSTPHDQSEGVSDALAAFGAPGRDVARLAHGTTVVTNLLLERRGARVTWSLGIEVGGPYTDLAAVGSDGLVETRKVLSTPHDQ